MTRTSRTPLATAPPALALAVALALAAAAPARAADWPMFRGPGAAGVSPETGLLEAWPDGGPRQLWRVPLGEGYSALSVADGRAYTLFADAEDELVIALDAATGKELWRHRLDAKYFDGQGNGPRSTPTVDAGTVYAYGARAKLAALDAASGRVLWTQDLKKAFAARPPQWGVSASPRVVGDLLLVDAGGRDGASIVALDRRSGVVKWTAGTDLAGYSVPLVVEIGGRRMAVFFTGSKVVGLDPAGGEILWSMGWKTSYDVNAAAPVFVPPNRIFVSSGYGVGAALLEIEVAGGRVGAREVWRTKGMKNQFSSSVYHDGAIYGFDQAILKCLDAATGEERWKARGFGHGSLMLADGHLYVLSDRGSLALVEATPAAYREVARFEPLTGKCWTMPSLADGRLFVRDEAEAAAFDVAEGETRRAAR
jgi:outer membrane protein assembly factor BamB